MIDAFSHLYPQRFVEYVQTSNLPIPLFFQNSPSFVDPEARIQELDRYEIARQAIAVGTPSFNEWFGPQQVLQACEAARIANDEIAQVVSKHPERFIGVAT